MYRQPLIVDAAMPAEAAACRLLLYDEAYPAVVRRQHGHRLLYYLFPVSALRGVLHAAAPGLTLAEALELGSAVWEIEERRTPGSVQDSPGLNNLDCSPGVQQRHATPAPVARGGSRPESYPAILLDENDQVVA